MTFRAVRLCVSVRRGSRTCTVSTQDTGEKDLAAETEGKWLLEAEWRGKVYRMKSTSEAPRSQMCPAALEMRSKGKPVRCMGQRQRRNVMRWWIWKLAVMTQHTVGFSNENRASVTQPNL